MVMVIDPLIINGFYELIVIVNKFFYVINKITETFCSSWNMSVESWQSIKINLKNQTFIILTKLY